MGQAAEIPVVLYQTSGARGSAVEGELPGETILGRGASQSVGREEFLLDSKEVAQRFTDFMTAISETFQISSGILRGYSIDQIELHLDMNAQGGFSLIGRGAMAESG